MSRGREEVISKLPIDIIFDIFSRLPLKTISECRWVSKKWYALIRNPSFIKLHHARALENNSCYVIFDCWWGGFSLLDNESSTETLATSYEIKFTDFLGYSLPFSKFNSRVVGMVNGLICFDHYNLCVIRNPTSEHRLTFYIFNPIMGDYIRLPLSPMHSRMDLSENGASGFGFDSLNNEYKVVWIYRNPLEYTNDVEVYTLGSDKWRVITSNVPYISGIRKSCVLFKNSLHWVAYIRGKPCTTNVILSFNLAKEEFSIIQLPPQFDIGFCDELRCLVALGKHLCFINGRVPGALEIWVMKEYGVKGSWVKEYGVRRESIRRPIQFSEMIELSNGEFLLFNHLKGICYYDPHKKASKLFEIYCKDKSVDYEPMFLAGSLFSPKNVGYY
ncbi:hypothetical protein IFM89_019330 [Coptis chinensis]|uniref:F-box domain-containing protein n=1 Tax=Coptis chinensis TaxID=261450 RepID=A0A835I5B1_9MAGN|nr:hypothetical protein IFM89_019330 [Coptis chinensis]